MATNAVKQAILRAKINGAINDIMPKTVASQVFLEDGSTLAAKLGTLAAQADLEALQQVVDALGALAKKDKVSQADLDEALAAVIGAKAEASALTEEIDRAKAAEKAASDAADAAQAAADKAQGDVNILIGDDAGKSARTIANEELAAQLIGENAKESLDTLAEIAAWIQEHPDDASAMNAAITALQQQLVGIDAGEGTVKKYVDDAITALKIGDYAKAADLTALAGRVEALEATADGLGALAVKDQVAEDDLEAELKAKVNAAAEGNHSHANKTELDKIAEGDKEKWDAAAAKAHEHDNKDVIDGITAENVAAWNVKGNIYYSATEPAGLTENDLWVALVD